jgi:hypothetical protein
MGEHPVAARRRRYAARFAAQVKRTVGCLSANGIAHSFGEETKTDCRIDVI